jgi:hypothetical protein
MAKQVVIHLNNEEPFVAEMEDMPPPGATYIVLMNPRTKEGKRVQWQTEGAFRYMFPFTRISFIEVMMSEQERDIQPWYRDDRR